MQQKLCFESLQKWLSHLRSLKRLRPRLLRRVAVSLWYFALQAASSGGRKTLVHGG